MPNTKCGPIFNFKTACDRIGTLVLAATAVPKVVRGVKGGPGRKRPTLATKKQPLVTFRLAGGNPSFFLADRAIVSLPEFPRGCETEDKIV